MHTGYPHHTQKLIVSIDNALDLNVNYTQLVLSNKTQLISNVQDHLPLSNAHLAIIQELLMYTMTKFIASSHPKWSENISLETIDLSQSAPNPYLDHEAVLSVSRLVQLFHNTITVISLSYFTITKLNAVDLASAVSICPSLAQLDLDNCLLKTTSLEPFIEEFTRQKTPLLSLNISQNDLTNSSMSILSLFIATPECKLNRVNISGNTVEREGIISLIASIRERKEQGLDDILKEVNVSSTLGCRDIHTVNEFVSLDVSIENLAIASNDYSFEDGQLIATAISKCKTMRKLNLSGNPLGISTNKALNIDNTAQASLLLSYLDVNSLAKITHLNLSECHIDCTLLLELGSILQRNLTLEELNISHNPLTNTDGTLPMAFLESLKVHPSLSVLNLSSAYIAYFGLVQLFAALSNNKVISELYISGNSMKLDYSTGNINSDPYSCIILFLSSNISLHNLDMSNMSFGDEVLLALGSGLKDNTTLKKFIGSGNNISIDGLYQLTALLAHNTTLHTCICSCQATQEATEDVYQKLYRHLITRSNVDNIII